MKNILYSEVYVMYVYDNVFISIQRQEFGILRCVPLRAGLVQFLLQFEIFCIPLVESGRMQGRNKQASPDFAHVGSTIS